MGVGGDLALALAGALAVLFAPLEIGFAVLVAFWLLVPGTLSVPHLPHLLLVDRFVLYAMAIRLLVRSGRAGEPRGGAFRLSATHVALIVLVAIGFIDGVLLPARSVPLAGDLHAWMYLLDLAVVSVIVLAVARTLGLWRTIRPVVVVLAVVVVIAVGERLTGRGWSHFFFEGLPINYLAPGANLLSTRGGHVRSQVAGQFALEYGWVVAVLLPLAIYGAVRWWHEHPRGGWVAYLLPVGMLVTVVLSGSRSAEIGGAAAAVLFVVLSGADRRLVRWGLVAGGILGLALLFDPSFVTGTFSTAAANDPASVRLDRLPELFSLVSHRQFVGLGLDGLTGTFGGTDDAYALLYATVGMLGVVAWVSMLVTAGASSGKSLRAPAGTDERMVGTACLVGLVGMAAACACYDVISTMQSQWTLVFLAALGTAAGESAIARGAAVVRRRWGLRALYPVYGLLFGFALTFAAPPIASQTISVLTVAPYVSAVEAGTPDVYGGTTLVNTLCAAVTDPRAILPGTHVECDQATAFFPLSPPSMALVTISAANAKAVREETTYAFTAIFHYMPIAGGPSEPVQVGKPAWALSAPLWAGTIGLLAMLLMPPVRRRRRPPGQGGDSSSGLPGPGSGMPVVEAATGHAAVPYWTEPKDVDGGGDGDAVDDGDDGDDGDGVEPWHEPVHQPSPVLEPAYEGAAEPEPEPALTPSFAPRTVTIGGW